VSNAWKTESGAKKKGKLKKKGRPFTRDNTNRFIFKGAAPGTLKAQFRREVKTIVRSHSKTCLP